MKKLLILLLLLGVAGSAWAANVWNASSSTTDWFTTANWSLGVVPDSCSTYGNVMLSTTTSQAPGPVILSGENAVAYAVEVSGPASGSPVQTLTIKPGATFTTSTYLFVSAPGTTVRYGDLIVEGGTVNIGTELAVGRSSSDPNKQVDEKGWLHMTGGTINVSGTFYIARWPQASGYVYLWGGTINTAYFSMRPNGGTGTASMDITTGTLIVNGDVRTTINTYITNGWLTSYADANGGTFNIDYNSINPGKTTVTATPGANPPGKATTPNPANSAAGVSTTAGLSWTAGTSATSHDVYFGTDSMPDETEFKGNQAGTTYNPGTMANGTTYYWRIDGKNSYGTTTGDVWSFTTMTVEWVVVDLNQPLLVSDFEIGTTHTNSMWESGNSTAVTRAKNLLIDGYVDFQNQHIMGWGVGNPQPTEGGAYSWADLDARINLITSMSAHSIPVITFCTAPGWMKHIGDWDENWWDYRVVDEHVTDFANLCKAVAQRYTEVQYFQVWNEMKGYWGSGNWDYVRYTNLYNAVYDAVKSVRPDAKIGGPYLGIQGDGGATIGKSGTDTFSPIGTPDWTVINYWLTNKHGADFFCFDRWLIDYHDENSYTNAERMLLTPFFGSVVAQIRAVDANLPIWISEFYGGMDAGGSPVSAFTAANHASCYYHSLINGASLALVWNPEEVVPADPRILNSLFTDTATSSGGQLTPHYNVVSAFNNYFYPGVQIYETTTSATNLEALASLDKTMLINKKSSAMTVTYGPNNITLSGYEVKVVNTPSATPGQATSPSPENNDTDVATNATLSWTAGSGATSHDVYFGTTSPGTFIGNQAGTTYNPGTLANSTTYYWRIDEKNASGTTTGVVWSFATAAPPAIFSDGFESGGFTAGGWTKQNTNATVTTSAKYTGAYGAKLAKATWMQKAVSTVGYNTIHVKYARKTSGLDTGENLYVEWSIDGSAWNNLETTQATTWASKDFTCGSGANDNANFRVRWRTNASGTNEYAYVDDVVITGTVQLFSDGFESGSFFAGGWTKENTNATVGTAAVYTGVYGARLPGITWIQKAVSTTGYNTIHVKYVRKTTALDAGENLYVEWSIDGSAWNNLETTQATTWASQDFTCGSGANNNADFRVRWRTNASDVVNEHAYVDDVVITGTAQ